MMDWIRLPEAGPSFGAMVGVGPPQPLPVLPLIGVLLAAWYGWGVYRGDVFRSGVAVDEGRPASSSAVYC